MKVSTLKEILPATENAPGSDWQLRVIQNEQCLSYLAWNTSTREALVIDPKREEFDSILKLARELTGYTWLGVFDTHTHADHVSCADKVAASLGTKLVMSEKSACTRVQVRVNQNTKIPSTASPVQFVFTPGHTQDGVCILWGPFLFTGDTILYGDTGRDDLPGGNPESHYESMQALKAVAKPDSIMLPGHEFKEARASSWKTQLSINASLTQNREDFVRESSAFTAAPPALLEESLKKNCE